MTETTTPVIPAAVRREATAAAVHAQRYPKVRGKDVTSEQAYQAVIAAYLATQKEAE